MSGLRSALKAFGGGSAPAGSPYQGKKWAALGTSITLSGVYTAPLATLLGANLTNLGVGSCAVSSAGDAAAKPHMVDQVASIPTDAALVTVEGGVNDFLLSVPLGVRGDWKIETSFYGAVDALLAAIYNRVPNADVAWLTPYTHLTYPGLSGNWYSPNNAGNWMGDFWAAIRFVCGYYSTPVIEVGAEAGVGGRNAAKYFSDGLLHINALGGQRVASYIAPRLIEARVS